jgi:predicted GNAT superfamily acetyltransferase
LRDDAPVQQRPAAQVIDLRPMDHADLPAVLALNNANVPAVNELDLAALGAIVDASAVALTAIDPFDGGLAGFCLVLPPGADYGSGNYAWFGERYDDFVYLDRVAVDAGRRALGVGRALYAEVEQYAMAQWFLLEVNLRPRNDVSLAFHERLGFTEVGQRETDYGFLCSMQAKRLR